LALQQQQYTFTLDAASGLPPPPFTCSMLGPFPLLRLFWLFLCWPLLVIVEVLLLDISDVGTVVFSTALLCHCSSVWKKKTETKKEKSRR
jgi:hypothetical protein